MATKKTSRLPQILFPRTRRLQSGISGKGLENFDEFKALVSSPSPMPNHIQIILDGKTATTLANANEPAARANSTSPNTSSGNSTKSDSSDQSSSNKDDSSPDKPPDSFLYVLKVCFLSYVAFISYRNGRERGAQDLTAQIPDGKIFTERESLRKEEERLKQSPEFLTVLRHCAKCDSMFRVRHHILRDQKKELAEKIEALDKEELEHLRKRAMVLERRLGRQKRSIETDVVRESLLEDVNGWMVQDKTHTKMVEASHSELPCILLPGPFPRIEEGPCVCPNCSGGNANPAMRQSEKSPSANVVPQVPSQGLKVNETPRTVPHQDDSTAHTKPDTETTGLPRTKTRPSPASNAILESLIADDDATNEEIGQIQRAKEALKSRERELEAQGKERKKRMQELNAPKSDQTWPIARGMVFGSALAFGVTMMIQK